MTKLTQIATFSTSNAATLTETLKTAPKIEITAQKYVKDQILQRNSEKRRKNPEILENSGVFRKNGAEIRINLNSAEKIANTAQDYRRQGESEGDNHRIGTESASSRREPS